MSSDAVLGVLINWHRPNNIGRVISAMRAQSVPVRVAVVECSPLHPQFSLPPQIRDMADIVFSVSENLGPNSRFIPPLALIAEHKWTYFGVDDHVPGPRHVECLLRTALMLGDDGFATVGQDGRLVRGGEIVKKRIHMEDGRAVPVDFVTSSELMLTKNIIHAITFRQAMHDVNGSDQFSFGGPDGGDFEDDLLLCFGIQRAIKKPCYLTPDISTLDESWRSVRLHAPDALCARPHHKELRDRVVRQAGVAGWRSLTEGSDAGERFTSESVAASGE